MRNEILDYIRTINLGGFKLSNELPMADSGVSLYFKNPKTIYVDTAQYSEEPFFEALNGFDIHTETTTVSIYFTADAKNLPANYDTLIRDLRLVKEMETDECYNTRVVNVNTEYVEDLLLVQIDYNFNKLS